MLHRTTQSRRTLRRNGPNAVRLEPRMMFDGAAPADVVEAVVDEPPVVEVAAPAVEETESEPVAVSINLAEVEQRAHDMISSYLGGEDAVERLFVLFNGTQDQPSEEWTARANELLERIGSGEWEVDFQFVGDGQMGNAYAAFTAEGPGGQPTIFLNAEWWQSQTDIDALTGVVVEEMGHAFDHFLNAGADTMGDEGEAFAVAVMGREMNFLEQARIAVEDDSSVIEVDGVAYTVETVKFNFVNAYEVDVSLQSWEAEKEANKHHYVSNVALGIARVDDMRDATYFSGNDVVVEMTIGETTYNGWISRPIKEQGIVRGFYFWYDLDFTTFDLAQADGNRDADRNAADNRAFVLVVDQAWFNSLPLVQGTNFKFVGSSSDRVDSALNALIVPNSAPVANHDVATGTEDGGDVTGNVLANDTDPDGDSLSVTAFTIAGQDGPFVVGDSYTIDGVGELVLEANGDYTFSPASNYNGTVPTVTYTVRDGNGDGALTSTATLSIIISAVNDAPTSTDYALPVAEGSTTALTRDYFGTFDDLDGDALALVKITALPAGTLEYWDGSEWQEVVLDQEITAAAIDAGWLRFTPSGTDPEQIGFQVGDGTDFSALSYTLTVSVLAGPTATDDALADGETDELEIAKYVAVEGVDGVAGSPAAGNVLENDTGTGLTVTSVSGAAVSGETATVIQGLYGKLTIHPNGVYSYAPDDENPLVDALNVGESQSESFIYTATDSGGRSVTGTLTVQIAGRNDAPVAADDFNAIKELHAAVAGAYGTATGNVLTNDTDVDNSSGATVTRAAFSAGGTETLGDNPVTVSDNGGEVSFTATAGAGGVSVFAVNTPINNNDIATLLGKQLIVNDVPQTKDGVAITVDSVTGNNRKLVTMSDKVVIGVGDTVTFATVNNFSRTVQNVGSTETTDARIISVDSDQVQVNMTVTGTNVAANTTVQSINADGTITLSQTPTGALGELTFTGAGGPTRIDGTYGYLTLGTTGGYTYTLTSNALDAGAVATETFTYEVRDANGATDTAVLSIRIDGTTNIAYPTDGNETLSTNEDSPLVQGVGFLLQNATNANQIETFSWDGQSANADGELTVEGIGSLTIGANGSFTFTPVANYNGPVPVVTYVVSNGGDEKVSSTLTITVNPINDAPDAQDDTAIAVEAGGYANANAGRNAVGNVLVNDSDADGDALTVTLINGQAVASSTTSANGTVITGTYGNLTIGADGSYVYAVSQNASVVQALNAGATPTETFTYTVSDGSATDTAVLTITIQGANDAPTVTIPALAGPATEAQDVEITGLEVGDVDDATLDVTLSVSSGIVTLGSLTNLTVVTGSNGSGTVTLRGAQEDLDAALATLVYRSDAFFHGADILEIEVSDSAGLTATSALEIPVTAQDRLVTVTGSTVNEASPWLMFKVESADGTPVGQPVTLALGQQGDTATIGADVLPTMQYTTATIG